RPRQIPWRTLVRGGDDRGPAPPPTHRPPRITPGVRTGHLPVQVSAAHPPRPPVRRPHRSLGAGPGRPARTGSGLADAPAPLRHPPRRRLRRGQPGAWGVHRHLERHTPGGVRPARRNAPRVGRRDSTPVTYRNTNTPKRGTYGRIEGTNN